MSVPAAFLETGRIFFRQICEADVNCSLNWTAIQRDFHYDADLLHGWVEQGRRAVEYLRSTR